MTFQFRCSCALRVSLIFIVSTTSNANVLSLFPIGSDAKSAAIESAVDSREPQSLLYNPAALALSKPGIQGEFGVGRLLYSYEHPSFDAVRVSVFSPMVSAGWRNDDSESNFHWGLAIAPTAMTQLKIKGLPRRVNGKQESLNIVTSRKQFHIPIGAAYSLQGDPRKSIGISLITTYDQRTLKADSLIDGAQLLDLSAKGIFYRPEIGFFYGFDALDIGMSYMAPVTKQFKGTTSIGAESFDTEQVDYDPAVLTTGVRTSIDSWTASFNVNRIFGARGETIIRDGTNRKTTSADVHDVNQFGARFAYQCDGANTISAAYAYLPTIWGAGTFWVDADGFTHHELGHLFGTFNAMPVRNQSLAWRYHSQSWDFNSSIFRSAGTQTIDLTGDNPGHYQIEFVSLTTGISRAL